MYALACLEVIRLRIALFGDVHGNTIALEQALQAIESCDPDVLVCLGDVATVGYDPPGAVRKVASLGCPVVMGNGDESLFQAPERSMISDPKARERIRIVDEIHAWGTAQLTEEDLALVREYRPVIELAADGLTVCACHGSPRSAWEPLLPSTGDEQIAEALTDTRAQVVVGGHTHVPLLRRVGERWLANAGSVGAPFSSYGGWGQVPIRPVAQWMLLTVDDGTVEMNFHEVPVDVGAILTAARASGMPHVEWWCQLWSHS